MLPPQDICLQKIFQFKRKYPNSRFDEFWKYKLLAEKTDASILDIQHIDTTTEKISAMLNSSAWGVCRTGVPQYSEIYNILFKIKDPYNKIRIIELGSGKIKGIREEISSAYTGLKGISNTNPKHHDPDNFGNYYIMGKSKVLMFLWGQTPGFDSRVVERFSLWNHDPAPYQLRHLFTETIQYSPSEFCDILEDLDEWVQKWPNSNNGQQFHSLCPEWPIGRIIDIVYWM
jgi:hypothetical protein